MGEKHYYGLNFSKRETKSIFLNGLPVQILVLLVVKWKQFYQLYNVHVAFVVEYIIKLLFEKLWEKIVTLDLKWFTYTNLKQEAQLDLMMDLYGLIEQ